MMDNRKKILLVEDEQSLAQLLAEYLEASGYAVKLRHEGRGIVAGVKDDPPDLLLLDLMLPGHDGLEICKEIRSFSNIPIIMVTARVEEIDRLLGLELGADDYICKPYSPREVVARVRAVLRRTKMTVGHKEMGVSALELDREKFRATYCGTVLDLTPVEFRLLDTLATSPGRVYSRDQLIEKIYNDRRIVTDRTVDTHIKNLRKKIEEAGAGSSCIHSVYGVGYKYEPIDD